MRKLTYSGIRLAIGRSRIAVLALAALAANAESRPTANSYLMVYHKDCDHSLHMAVSDDSYNWRAVREGDKPVMDGREIAEQKGIRDPFIFRALDGTYLVAATDLHLFAKREGLRETDWERDGAKYGWGNNRGIVLLKSRDLINWERYNLDFSKFGGDWEDVGCVWAPEMVWDDEAKSVLMHFTVRFGNAPTRIYAAHLTADMTAIAEIPRAFFVPPTGWNGETNYGILDSDIVKDDNGLYHLFYCSHEYTATIRHATSKSLFGPYKADYGFCDGEKRGHEAPCCWRRPDGTWVLMWDRYSMTPHNFGFAETKDFREWKLLGYFDQKKGVMRRTGFAEQKHGGVAIVPKEDVERLEVYWNGK